MHPDNKPLAVSIGEPAGIGADVLLIAAKLAQEGQTPPLPSMVVYGNHDHLEDRAKALAIGQTTVESIAVEPLSNTFQSKTGQADPTDGHLIVEALVRSVEAIRDGKVCGLVTLPINKKALYDSGFEFPGHTEFLANLGAKLFEARKDIHPVMMLAGPSLRTIPTTIHMQLQQAVKSLTTELIVETAQIAASDLTSKFSIKTPRLAISGLNPHAGEEGSLGHEDEAIIKPAVEQLQREGYQVVGPLPADTMFHESARKSYDVAICMYHDQALIPAKTLAFDEAVNVTLGLPFIRTSPDHGTALDIAGTGKANPSSFIAALRMAESMAAHVS